MCFSESAVDGWYGSLSWEYVPKVEMLGGRANVDVLLEPDDHWLVTEFELGRCNAEGGAGRKSGCRCAS